MCSIHGQDDTSTKRFKNGTNQDDFGIDERDLLQSDARSAQVVGPWQIEGRHALISPHHRQETRGAVETVKIVEHVVVDRHGVVAAGREAALGR